VSYTVDWIPGAVFLGAALLLLIVPSFAVIGLMVVALAALAALVALAGAILAMPYLLIHSLRRRLAERRRPRERSLPTARAIAQTRRPTKRSGVAALTGPTTARRTHESVGPIGGQRRGRRSLHE
jgi:membrane protein implicated in regulation of membrane protease activity